MLNALARHAGFFLVSVATGLRFVSFVARFTVTSYKSQYMLFIARVEELAAASAALSALYTTVLCIFYIQKGVAPPRWLAISFYISIALCLLELLSPAIQSS